MLRKFSVEGYRGFASRITLDLTQTIDYQFNCDAIEDGLVKTALVYGRNGIGKTNLGRAMLDARNNVALDAAEYRADSSYLNADTERSCARFCYDFDFDGQNVIYEYSKNRRGVIRSERLAVDELVVYDIDEAGNLKENNLEKFTTGSLSVGNKDIYLSLSFLSYVCANTPSHMLGPVLSLYKFLLGMQFNGLAMFDEDLASVIEEHRVADLEAFLHSYGIEEALRALPTPSGEQVLYLQKNARNLPLSEACSSGTRALIRLFVITEMPKSRPSLLFLDEFDAFYHHDLAELVLKRMIETPSMQVIATTHNTDLFSNKTLRPDCLFVLSPKSLTAAAYATNRALREGHNLERLYKAGEFNAR